MSQEIPQTVKKWTVIGHDGPDSLDFKEEELVSTLGDNQVLVKSEYFDTHCFPTLSTLMSSPSPRSVSKRMITVTPALAFVDQLIVS